MDDSLILILDPLNSSLKEHISNTLAGYKNIKFLYFDINDLNSKNNRLHPSLIVILLDNCGGEDVNITQLNELPEIFPAVPIVCIINTMNKCNECLKCKEFSWYFVPAPVKSNDIKVIISWFLKNDIEEKSETIENLLKQRSLMDLFIGESKSSLNIKNRIYQIAPYDVTVLIQGETGTGKELTAKLIHYLSKRSVNPFVAVNCGTIPNELFENELYGHNKGAYTHADSRETGLVNSADKGTLFLDEIESLPLSSQVKLLRFIEEKKYKPLGTKSFLSSDVRIIAASNKDLARLVSEGKFREDLFYRLSVVNILIPPLRDRRDDISSLTKYFVEKYSKMFSKEIRGIKPDAMLNLTYYDWPGNVREMENIIQEAVIFSRDNFIDSVNLNFKNDKNNSIIKTFNQSKKQNIEEFERKYLNTVLRLFNGNISKASEYANKNRREFYRLINKYNLLPGNYRKQK